MDRALRREVFVALGLATGPAVALGFSRFAYALLLPPMRDALAWSYVQAGAVNTANGVGYIVGAAIAAALARRAGAGRSFLAAMALSAVALAASGATASFHALLVLRALGGVANAVAFVVGAGLASGLAAGGGPRRATLPVALYVAGASGGIVVSGLVLPGLVAALGAPGWRAGWLAMGALSFAALAPAALAVRAVGEGGVREAGRLPARVVRGLAPSFAGYGLFGAGYVSYMTFVVVLVREAGAGVVATSAYWVLLGASSIAGTLLWGRVLGGLRPGIGPGLVSAVLVAGALPVLVWPGMAAATVSAVLFGGTFMAGPMAMTMVVRRLVAPALATSAIAALTLAFAIGQAVGPILSGYVTDLTGSVAAGVWVAPVVLAASAALWSLQRSRPLA